MLRWRESVKSASYTSFASRKPALRVPCAPVEDGAVLTVCKFFEGRAAFRTFHRAGAKGARLASSISGVSTGRIAGASVEHGAVLAVFHEFQRRAAFRTFFAAAFGCLVFMCAVAEGDGSVLHRRWTRVIAGRGRAEGSACVNCGAAIWEVGASEKRGSIVATLAPNHPAST